MLHVISGNDPYFVFDDTQPNRVVIMSDNDLSERLDAGEVAVFDCLVAIDENGEYCTFEAFTGGTDIYYDEPDVDYITEEEYEERKFNGEYFFLEYEMDSYLDMMCDKDVLNRTGVKVIVADGHILYLDCTHIEDGTTIRLSDYGTFYEKGSLRDLLHGRYTVIVDDKVDCCNELVFSYEGDMTVQGDIVFQLESPLSSFEAAIESLELANMTGIVIK